MRTDRTALSVPLLGILAALLLGCSSDPRSPTNDPAATVQSTQAASDASTAPDSSTDRSPRPSAGSTKPSVAESDDSGDSGVVTSDETSDSSGQDSNEAQDSGEAQGDTESDGQGPGIEIPVAPEPSITSLSELLPEQNSSPLVTAPLPGAARARDRLVSRFPAAVRPLRASRVASSSLSPSGDRLQVALVASTSLSPDAVLRAYRARLAARGLAEESAPSTVSGSQAAAFGRGLSVVTITATPEGSRTTYSIHAVLHTGRE